MRASVVGRGCLAVFAFLVPAATVWSSEDKPTRQDAAEAVKEGDVTQWLQHYRRERGDGWSEQVPSAEQPPPPTSQRRDDAKAEKPDR